METEQNSEVVDLVHSLFIQSRPTSSAPVEVTPIKIKSVPTTPCLPRSQSFPVRKKVQIKSAPLKPPDIGNVSLFPSVEESIQSDCLTPSPKRMQLKSVISNINRSGCDFYGNEKRFDVSSELLAFEEAKLKTLEAKLTEPLGLANQLLLDQTIEGNSRRASLGDFSSTPSRKTPRSAKLFSELSSEKRQKLDDLSDKFSNAIDSNECRNVLDELEFVFQFLNTSGSSTKMPLSLHIQSNSDSEEPLLTSAAEHAYFAIKIVINQLNKLCSSLPLCLIQLIIDNYPHKIPKPVRKHIEEWIGRQNVEPLKDTSVSDALPSDLCKTVTFKSEKDGRANFPHQTDFHAFCKQRDMFYFIRENWTNTSSGAINNGNSNNRSNSGVILDRDKSRMSFPPASTSTSSRFIDSLPFKVQSLFQINNKPTNLFHMASLFVAHYLLEARASEVGGIPKDNNMKEFFQSNPNKLLQLNSRFSTASGEALDGDQLSSLQFHREFLLASTSKFVQHVIDKVVNDIMQAEVNMDCDLPSNPTHICRIIKDNIHLARLLGFAIFLPYNHEGNSNTTISIEKESIIHEHIQIRNYQRPPLELNLYLEKACKMGRLTATCPWILEYLLQCDSVSLQLASYQPVLVTLFSLYKNVLKFDTSSNGNTLSTPNKNFLRFYMGMLFSSKNLPDAIFSSLKNQEPTGIISKFDANIIQSAAEKVDSLDLVAHNLTNFCFSATFNRLKRTLTWGRLEVSHPAMTGEIRHIRPIPATDKCLPAQKAQLTKEKMIQTQLETTFFDLYPVTVKRSVDFVSERMASNFISIAKSQLFPNVRSMLANQGVFGVRASEKCRVKITEEMSKYFLEKCDLAVKLFLERSTSPGVLRICQKVAHRKAREVVNGWIKNYINAGMFPDIGSEGGLPNAVSTSSTPASLQEDPPFEILISIHRMIRTMNSKRQVEPLLVDKILACPTFGKAQWTLHPLMEWGICLITFQPKLLSSVRIKQLTTLWKSSWSPGVKVVNARNLMIMSKSEAPRDSWIKLGSVMQHLIADKIVNVEDLEQQCLQLLSEEWPDQTHKRISEFLTLVLESFHGRAEWHSESAQVLDWVAWLCSGQADQE